MAEVRARKLEQFIRSNLMPDPNALLDLDTSLVDNGSLDSMGATLLAAFVEEQFGVMAGDTAIAAGRLDTMRRVLALIDEHLG
jgi:acyl carrier protein